MKHLKFLAILLIFTACASTQTTAQIKEYVSYTVKSGETLKSIAAANNMSKRDLKRLNPDVRNKPRANTVIIIPKKNKVISQPNLNTNGKTHTVQRKETLFSISKKYHVSVEDLKKENHLISNDLSLGQVLKIPTNNDTPTTYIVKSKETLFSISKKFGVSVDDLKRVNHLTSNDLSLGQVLKIPSKETDDKDAYSMHTVKLGETFYSLTKAYGISEKELLSLNPAAKFGLKEGMLLKVPKLDVDAVIETPEKTAVFTDEIRIDRPVDIAILLPFNLNKTTSLESEFLKKTSLLNVTTDFYMGVLMAIESLRKQGLEINFRSFDTKNDMATISSIVSQNNLEDADVVIGPLYFDKAYNLSKKLRKTMVVAPMFSKKQAASNSPNLIKAGVDKKLFKKTLLNYIKKQYDGQKIILIGDASPATTSQMTFIAASLKKHDSINNITIVKEENGYIGKERLDKVVSETTENWVIFVGKNKVITMDAITNLGVLAQTRKVHLFAIENNKYFKTSNNNHLAKMKFTFAQETMADVKQPAVMQFFKDYKSKNFDIPTANAIKGFDLTYDIIMRIAAFNNLKDGLQAGVSKRMGSKYDYQKKMFSSFENNGVQIIQYNKDLYPVVLE